MQEQRLSVINGYPIKKLNRKRNSNTGSEMKREEKIKKLCGHVKNIFHNI